MNEILEQRVIDLQAQVDSIVAQLAHLKANPTTDVAAAQAKVDAAIAELRAEKLKPTKWSTRTSDANKLLRQHWQLEQAVRDNKRDLLITGRAYFDQITALNRKLYEVRRWLATAQEQKENGGTFLFAI